MGSVCTCVALLKGCRLLGLRAAKRALPRGQASCLPSSLSLPSPALTFTLTLDKLPGELCWPDRLFRGTLWPVPGSSQYGVARTGAAAQRFPQGRPGCQRCLSGNIPLFSQCWAWVLVPHTHMHSTRALTPAGPCRFFSLAIQARPRLPTDSCGPDKLKALQTWAGTCVRYSRSSGRGDRPCHLFWGAVGRVSTCQLVCESQGGAGRGQPLPGTRSPDPRVPGTKTLPGSSDQAPPWLLHLPQHTHALVVLCPHPSILTPCPLPPFSPLCPPAFTSPPSPFPFWAVCSVLLFCPTSFTPTSSPAFPFYFALPSVFFSSPSSAPLPSSLCSVFFT